MKQAIILDLRSNRPIVKGDVIYDCPAFIDINVTANNEKYEGSELIEGRQRFNKEFYESKLMELDSAS